MKKNILVLSALTLIGGALLLTSCSKEDLDAPEITITGGSASFHSLNTAFTNPAATATDEEDGDLTASITVTGTVNKDLAGDYILTYKVTDAAGNEGTATHTVTVRNDAYEWVGNYNVVDTCGSPNPIYTYSNTSVAASTTINNRVVFTKFADYSNNNSIYGTISANGQTIDIPSQTATGIGSSAESHTFSGTGTKTTTGFRLTYTDVNNSASGASATCRATFTKR